MGPIRGSPIRSQEQAERLQRLDNAAEDEADHNFIPFFSDETTNSILLVSSYPTSTSICSNERLSLLQRNPTSFILPCHSFKVSKKFSNFKFL
ncbi:hypothetical protein ACFX13_031417 [Malus domestica]